MTAIRAHWHNPEQARESLLTVIAPWAKAQMDAGESVDVYLSVHEDDRSLRQNKFLWSYVYRQISHQAVIDGIGADEDGWHLYFKKRVLGFKVMKTKLPGKKRKSIHRELRSTTKLKVPAFSKYLEQVMAIAATEFGVTFGDAKWETWDDRQVDQSTGEILEHA